MSISHEPLVHVLHFDRQHLNWPLGSYLEWCTRQLNEDIIILDKINILDITKTKVTAYACNEEKSSLVISFKCHWDNLWSDFKSGFLIG